MIKLMVDGREVPFANDICIFVPALGENEGLTLKHTVTHEGVINDVLDDNNQDDDVLATEGEMFEEIVERLTEEDDDE